jgi:hypothetical protein
MTKISYHSGFFKAVSINPDEFTELLEEKVGSLITISRVQFKKYHDSLNLLSVDAHKKGDDIFCFQYEFVIPTGVTNHDFAKAVAESLVKEYQETFVKPQENYDDFRAFMPYVPSRLEARRSHVSLRPSPSKHTD